MYSLHTSNLQFTSWHLHQKGVGLIEKEERIIIIKKSDQIKEGGMEKKGRERIDPMQVQGMPFKIELGEEQEISDRTSSSYRNILMAYLL